MIRHPGVALCKSVSEQMQPVLSDQERATFARDGVVFLPDRIDERWRARIAAVIDRDMAAPGPFHHHYESEHGRFHATSRLWQSDPDARAYVFESPLPALAAQLLGSRKVNLLYDQIFVKEPGTEAPTAWHQDHVVWPIEGSQVISFWLALDRVTRKSSAVEYIRGSHRWNRRFQPYPLSRSRVLNYPRDPALEEMPDIDTERDKYDIVSWDMEPGDLVAFHSLIVHGAGGNFTTDQRRRGYSVRYTGEDVRFSPHLRTMKVLENPELRPGQPLDSTLFPIVWQA